MFVQRLAQLRPECLFFLGGAITAGKGEKACDNERYRRGVSLTRESKRHWLKVHQQSQIENLKSKIKDAFVRYRVRSGRPGN